MNQGRRRAVSILGSTGSIGTQALDLIERFPERFEVVALAAGRNAGLLARQIERHRPRLAVIADESGRDLLRAAAREARCEIVAGEEGLLAAAGFPAADIVVAAVVGAAGLPATYHALKAGKRVALANKESLVTAGPLLQQAARETGGSLVPVDSEHSAVHQCLRGATQHEIRRVILTASGGPFRTLPLEALKTVTPEQALRHPVWDMGKKISIDSATLMNKGLEVIEARWLFDLEPERLDVLLHPQSVVHSMVEMVDGSILCQMGVPDMRAPIQYALGYPDRFRAALDEGGTAPAALNAANETAVQAFLSRRLDFPGIARVVAGVLERHRPVPVTSIDCVLETDAWSRGIAEEIMTGGGGR